MRTAAITALCLTQFVDVLGVTSATTAIPAILAGIGSDESAAALVATAYAMFFGGMLMLGARLGDRYGPRRVLLAGIALFIAVSLVGGLATSAVQVVAARALQGTAAAISVPCALRLLLHVTPDAASRRTALAAWSAAGAAAGAAGFLVGGALVVALGWRSVFWINAPVGVVLAAGVLLLVRTGPVAGDRRPLDVLGAALLVGSIMLVISGTATVLPDASPALGGALVTAGVVVGAGFVLRLRRARDPLIPRAAFRSKNLRRGAIASFVNTATTSGPAVLATLALQGPLHLDALTAGLVLMSLSVGVVLGSLATRWLAPRMTSPAMAALGLAIVGAGDAVFALPRAGAVVIGSGAALAGLGLGAASVAATTIGTDVDGALAGSASGIVNTAAQLGTALGTAALILVATMTSAGIAWLVAAATALLTSAAALHWSRTTPHLGAS